MRLVDADNLIKDIKVERTNLYMEGLRETPRSYEYLNQLQNKLENAETVDAVPLKWLASWTKKYIEKTRTEVGVLSEKAVTVAEAFNEMKHDWRKENESDSNI